MSVDIRLGPRRHRRWAYAIVAVVIILMGGIALYYLGAFDTMTSRGRGAVVGGAILYICPMHPTYTSDRPGECPICGMTLVPAEEEVEEGRKHEAEPTPPGHAAIRVTPTQRQAIGVRLATTAMRVLTKEIRTVGTVAYDPKLAVAQREYLSARRLGDRALAKAAEERLHLMGMSKDQIHKLARAGRIQKNLYLPGPKGAAWIYTVIYEMDIPYVREGQEVHVIVPGQTPMILTGTIAAIDPVLDPQTRTVTVRSEVEDPRGLLKPNQYVDVYIRVPLGTWWWNNPTSSSMRRASSRRP
jgi:hypothetical protein